MADSCAAPGTASGKPAWRWDAFAGEFCDAFIKSTGLEGACGSAPSIDELVSVVRQQVLGGADAPALLEPADLATLDAVLEEVRAGRMLLLLVLLLVPLRVLVVVVPLPPRLLLALLLLPC